MANVLTKGDLLPTEIEREMFDMVRGKSSLAVLSAERPIPFNGVTEFTFNLDKEADIVGENGAKTNGGATVAPVTIRPYKFEYGTRVSDEFMKGTEEYRMEVLRKFAEGASKKFAKALDIAAMHGVNPRTGAESDIVGDNCFDKKVTNKVTYAAASADANIDAAIAQVEAADAMANGIVIAPAVGTALANMKAEGGARLYPDFAFGATPENLGTMRMEKNVTVSKNSTDMAIVGDFDAFRWGYAEGISYEVIEYGNPDNDAEAGDLKGHNQVYLRAEAYIGWGILAPAFFSRIVTA
jgi:HK97 family phage major capsid protein